MRKTYALNKAKNGADNYGSWLNGVQIRSERINGRTLTYDAKKQEWR